jgi:hypothetical protein
MVKNECAPNDHYEWIGRIIRIRYVKGSQKCDTIPNNLFMPVAAAAEDSERIDIDDYLLNANTANSTS